MTHQNEYFNTDRSSCVIIIKNMMMILNIVLMSLGGVYNLQDKLKKGLGMTIEF